MTIPILLLTTSPCMVLLSPVKTLIYSIAFLSLVIFMPKLQTSLTRSALHLASISVKPITQRIPPFTIIPPPGRIATRISGISLPFALFSSSSKASAGEDKMGGEHAVKKSDTEWRAVLSPEQVGPLLSMDYFTLTDGSVPSFEEAGNRGTWIPCL